MAYKLSDKIQFGKHKSKTIKNIIESDPTYIEWALDEIDDFELDDDAFELYEQEINQHYWNEQSDYPSLQ